MHAETKKIRADLRVARAIAAVLGIPIHVTKSRRGVPPMVVLGDPRGDYQILEATEVRAGAGASRGALKATEVSRAPGMAAPVHAFFRSWKFPRQRQRRPMTAS